MDRTGFFIATALLLDGLAGLAGGLLSERWLRRRQAALVGFAAGALLAAAFLDVLPESIVGLGNQALVWAFAGFVALAIMEWRAGPHHRSAEGALTPMLPAALLTSDALHNIGDGAAVAAAFLSSFEAGLSVALAVVAHEIPQEVGDYAAPRSRYEALASAARAGRGPAHVRSGRRQRRSTRAILPPDHCGGARDHRWDVPLHRRDRSASRASLGPDPRPSVESGCWACCPELR